MDFPQPLFEGILRQRYKRFLADIVTFDEKITTVHCTNTGSMKGVLLPPQRAWCLESNNPKRKLSMTLEILETHGELIGVNTHRTNALALEGIKKGIITELENLQQLQTEKKYGENSRIDILGMDTTGKQVYIEVKNVSLKEGTTALFPDSVTERGTKHLRELMNMVKNGERAVMLYIAQRGDVTSFAPAKEIDPIYAKTLWEAVACGVEIYAYNCLVLPTHITVHKALKII